MPKKSNRLKPYNWGLVLGITLSELLIAFAICLFLFPWLVNSLINVIVKQLDLCSNNIVDYFGGFLGVILGFAFDLILIDKIRKLLQYRRVILSLNNEFTLFIDTFKRLDQETDTPRFRKLEAAAIQCAKDTSETFSLQAHADFLQEWLHVYGIIRLPIVEGCILNSDAMNLLSKLPRCFLLADLFGKPLGNLSNYLYNIWGAVKRFNESHNDDKTMRSEEVQTLWLYIEQFFIMTTKEKQEYNEE